MVSVDPGAHNFISAGFFITSQLVFRKSRSSVIVPRRTILTCNLEAFRQKRHYLGSYPLFPSQSRLMITSYKLILTGRPRQACNRCSKQKPEFAGRTRGDIKILREEQKVTVKTHFSTQNVNSKYKL